MDIYEINLSNTERTELRNAITSCDWFKSPKRKHHIIYERLDLDIRSRLSNSIGNITDDVTEAEDIIKACSNVQGGFYRFLQNIVDFGEASPTTNALKDQIFRLHLYSPIIGQVALKELEESFEAASEEKLWSTKIIISSIVPLKAEGLNNEVKSQLEKNHSSKEVLKKLLLILGNERLPIDGLHPLLEFLFRVVVQPKNVNDESITRIERWITKYAPALDKYSRLELLREEIKQEFTNPWEIEYFNNSAWQGKPIHVEREANIQFSETDRKASETRLKNYTVRWRRKFESNEGVFYLYNFYIRGEISFLLDGEEKLNYIANYVPEEQNILLFFDKGEHELICCYKPSSRTPVMDVRIEKFEELISSNIEICDRQINLLLSEDNLSFYDVYDVIPSVLKTLTYNNKLINDVLSNFDENLKIDYFPLLSINREQKARLCDLLLDCVSYPYLGLFQSIINGLNPQLREKIILEATSPMIINVINLVDLCLETGLEEIEALFLTIELFMDKNREEYINLKNYISTLTNPSLSNVMYKRTQLDKKLINIKILLLQKKTYEFNLSSYLFDKIDINNISKISLCEFITRHSSLMDTNNLERFIKALPILFRKNIPIGNRTPIMLAINTTTICMNYMYGMYEMLKAFKTLDDQVLLKDFENFLSSIFKKEKNVHPLVEDDTLVRNINRLDFIKIADLFANMPFIRSYLGRNTFLDLLDQSVRENLVFSASSNLSTHNQIVSLLYDILTQKGGVKAILKASKLLANDTVALHSFSSFLKHVNITEDSNLIIDDNLETLLKSAEPVIPPKQYRNLNGEEILNIVEIFLKCRCIIDFSQREEVITSLPLDITYYTTHFLAPLNAKEQIDDLLNACLKLPNGFNTLLKIVDYHDGGTLAYNELENYLREINYDYEVGFIKIANDKNK